MRNGLFWSHRCRKLERARADDRRVINAIFYVLRIGTPWRDSPERYGLHDGLQPLQPLVSTRHLETSFRLASLEIARQHLSGRQYDRESPSSGKRRKGGRRATSVSTQRATSIWNRMMASSEVYSLAKGVTAFRPSSPV